MKLIIDTNLIFSSISKSDGRIAEIILYRSDKCNSPKLRSLFCSKNLYQSAFTTVRFIKYWHI